MENQQNISNEAVSVNTEINTSANETVINSNETTNDFDITKYFSEDLKKDADFERLSKNIPTNLNALVKDLYHKTKHFGKARDVVKAELEAEMNKSVSYEENDYQYKMPENYIIEDELLSNAKAKAIELGIKPEQFKSFMETMLESDAKIKSSQEQELKKAEEEAVQSLKKEWGNDYDKKISKAETMLQYFTSSEDDEKIQNLPAEAKILLAKMMDKVSQKIQEPTIGKIGSSIPAKMSESEFHNNISAIKNDNMLTANQKNNKIAQLYGEFYSKEDMKKEFNFS
jgi:hypothetical protein